MADKSSQELTSPMGKENLSSRDVFLEFLAEKGLKLTRQREAVIDEIFKDTSHFEPEDIVGRLKAKQGYVSRATVYRTLELLRESQLVEKLDIERLVPCMSMSR